ncbi:MAG: signal peptide peptidase SppA [Syntrophomonadaceae bacterium]|jgi:protease-4|nr:signal peptide peptidase SppA [Syntrophomonadaceae bacterium]
MEKKLVAGVFILFLFVMTVISGWKVFFGDNTDNYGSKLLMGDKVGVIEINGVISENGSVSVFGGGGTASQSIVKAMHRVAERPDIKAVVLRINSPGGSSAASQEIGIELDRLKQSGKIIITSMGEACASGGYWIASGSDFIMANGTTLTGSIGVIMEWANLQELYEKLGIRMEVLKSGEFKDMGSSARSLTEGELQMFDAMIQDTYQQFLDKVQAGRGDKIEAEKLLEIADGRVFTGRQALNLGLVDGLGNYYDALDKAKELAGLPKDTGIEIINGSEFWEYFNFPYQTSLTDWLKMGIGWDLKF